jgi:hypothetical protein
VEWYYENCKRLQRYLQSNCWKWSLGTAMVWSMGRYSAPPIITTYHNLNYFLMSLTKMCHLITQQRSPQPRSYFTCLCQLRPLCSSNSSSMYSRTNNWRNVVINGHIRGTSHYSFQKVYKHIQECSNQNWAADCPALRPDGPRSGRSAPVGRTVRACGPDGPRLRRTD